MHNSNEDHPRRQNSPKLDILGAENLVCLSEKFHTHQNYHDFYERYCNAVNGFTGCYGIVIRMGEILTDWEINKGGKELYDRTEVIWDDLVEAYVDKYFEKALTQIDAYYPPNAEDVFKLVRPNSDLPASEPQKPKSRKKPKEPRFH